MDKDIRKILLHETVEKRTELSTNHRARFQQKLQEELHIEKSNKRKGYQWLYIAASVVIFVGIGLTFFSKTNTVVEQPIVDLQNNTDSPQTQSISLGSVSPELKTVEAYYLNTINYELSQLELTNENKELFDGYLLQLESLTKEYTSLTEELNTKGINDDTINALIGNLQLRLQLLKRMQKQLHEFKNPNQNDIQTI